MSKETRNWLSRNVLVGFTEKRGNAWHYREGDQNHYPGPIPVEDVHHRLFHWTAQEKELYVKAEVGEGAMLIPGRKAIVRSDTGAVLGIFRAGYQPHQYGEWLLDNVANIIDDDLQIGSAGLLREGAVAWVSVEVPDNIITPEGVVFRPFLLAATSFDGTVATTYKRVVTNVVCDNTMRAALDREQGQVFRVRHSAKSLSRLGDARDALGIVHGIAEEFSAQVASLSSVKVDDRTFERVVNLSVPMPQGGPDGAGKKRAVALAEKKRDALWRMWREDDRVAPWNGTAMGAWQAFNTYEHHERAVRKGAARAERNMMRTVSGEIETADAEVVHRILALAA
ncbi:hypothetical protein BJP40_06345 [Streptomyces sp. CC53]|uniref:DUF932 domain-containing protein n=1 Tax=Streptomyces sp. CC53 TaxID=1906740 RepID=UPI0008DE4604|nr:DUF932 domain-containing protein [Streptomyces sp. CC53]OII61143.1 hypothetical protein BJP40_06345 [Streptomyces sp. CC53]